jgi:hypothetical protein
VSLRLASLALAACLAAPAAFASGDIPLDAASFTTYMAERLQAEIKDVPIEVTGSLAVIVGTSAINMERIFRDCKASTGDCDPAFDRFVHGVVEAHRAQGPVVDASAVRLVVRRREAIDHVLAAMGATPPRIELEPLPGGLVAVPVLAAPRAAMLLSGKALDQLGLDHEKLFELARKNMQQSLAPLMDKAKPVGPGQIGSLGGGAVDAGRVTLPGQWAPLAEAQHGTLVIALPTTDLVLYIAEATPAALDGLAAFAKNTAARAANPLAPGVLLRWRDGRWEAVN